MQNLFHFLVSAGIVFIIILATMFFFMKHAQKRLNTDTDADKNRAESKRDMSGAPADKPAGEK